MNIDYIKQLAYEFRIALDIVVEKKMYGRLSIFQYFPRECCRYVSDLLAEYMMDHGISRNRIELVEAQSIKENYTHCWLVIDDALFVDITADQFNGKAYFKRYEPISSCTIVPHGTYLYECFTNGKMQYTHNIGIYSYGGDISFKLKIVYDAVIQYINKNRQGR